MVPLSPSTIFCPATFLNSHEDKGLDVLLVSVFTFLLLMKMIRVAIQTLPGKWAEQL